MNRNYRVELVNKATGKGVEVELQADSPEDARSRVSHTGCLVGSVRIGDALCKHPSGTGILVAVTTLSLVTSVVTLWLIWQQGAASSSHSPDRNADGFVAFEASNQELRRSVQELRSSLASIGSQQTLHDAALSRVQVTVDGLAEQIQHLTARAGTPRPQDSATLAEIDNLEKQRERALKEMDELKADAVRHEQRFNTNSQPGQGYWGEQIKITYAKMKDKQKAIEDIESRILKLRKSL